jgi:hypothetical protein
MLENIIMINKKKLGQDLLMKKKEYEKLMSDKE